MEDSMARKVCIVTGASSGLGEAIAIFLASRGASVVLCGRDQDSLKKAVNKCVKASGNRTEKFLTVAGDNNRQDVRKAIVEATIQKFHKLDVFIASAGIFPHNGNILTSTEEMYDRIMDSNVKAVAFFIQLVVPHLEKTKGNIVLISSFGSVISCSPDNIYAMSKAAIDHLTRCLVLDLGPKGVRINTVRPSFIPTGGITRERGGDAVEMGKAYANVEGPKHPLFGHCLPTEAIAEAVAFLASSSASYITGQCLLVDGGRTLSGPLLT